MFELELNEMSAMQNSDTCVLLWLNVYVFSSFTRIILFYRGCSTVVIYTLVIKSLNVSLMILVVMNDHV